MKSRSSIFSSESLAELRIPRDWWASLAVVVLLVVTAEIVARVLLAPIGDFLWAYESTAQSRSFEWYRDQAQNGNPPAVAVIGDSTGARNFDPQTFGVAAGMENVVNLARPGNFPRAVRSNSLPLFDQDNLPRFVILMQWPESLREDPRTDQIEAGAVSPVLEARLDGALLPTDITYLARLFPARQYLLDYWVRGRPLIRPANNQGFFPLDPESTPVVRANPTLTNDSELRFSEARRDVIVDLVRLAEARNFEIIVPMGPYRVGDNYAFGNRHFEWLENLQAEHCDVMHIFDFRIASGIAYEDCKDNPHLYESGAKVWSEQFGYAVRDCLNQPAELRTRCP